LPDIQTSDIELLNAHGPYNHAVWKGAAGQVLTHEEALTGRGEFIAAALRRVLTSRFSETELRSFSIVDVGCYDGWLLHQLSDLPFARMLGIEPRQKNIRKGQIARKILGIESSVEFMQGSLDDLPAAQFDIVVATGLLHHTECTVQALRALRRICGKLLFVETIVLDSKHLTPDIRRDVEPKDVIYFGREPVCGMSGQKLESAFYDGSSTGLHLVSIPTWETLTLACEAAGFSPPVQESSSSEYREASWKERRACQAAIFTAEPARADQTVTAVQHGAGYERQLAATILPLAATAALSSANSLDELSKVLPHQSSPPAQEIIASFRHAPEDKIRVEHGKALLQAGQLDAAETAFLGVVHRWNADWRSVYRSFHYLRCIARIRKDRNSELRYTELLAVTNPHFPADAWPIGDPQHV